MRQIYFLLFFALMICGCAGHQLKVTSEPSQADVYLLASGQPPKNIGRTPFEAPYQLSTYGSESFEVAISKKGFETVRVVFPNGRIPSSSDLFVQLPALSSGDDASRVENLQKLARGIAEAKNLIEKKEMDIAETKLNLLSEQYPSVSVIHDLMGNIHFIRRDFSKALAAYRRSDVLAPGNVETTRMIKRIEELRSTAGGSQ